MLHFQRTKIVAHSTTNHHQEMVWNGTEISAWNMEDDRMEWNRRFQEWNRKQSSILPYQVHTSFRSRHLLINLYNDIDN